MVVLAFLMVSTFRYRSVKGFDLRRRRSYMTVLGIALLLVLIVAHPEASLLAVTSLYTASGPVALGSRRAAPAQGPVRPGAGDRGPAAP